MLPFKEQFHDMLFCDWTQKTVWAQYEASIYRAAFVIFLNERVYMQTRLFAVYQSDSCRSAFFEKSFQFFSENKTQRLLHQFHSILLYH